MYLDIYVVVGKGRFLGENWINRYWYLWVDEGDATSVAEQLVNHIYDNVYSRLAPVFSDNWVTDSVEAYPWANPEDDYYALETPIAGANSTDDPVPSAIALSYRSTKPTPGKRYGHKRFAGLTENLVNGNGVVSTVNFTDVGTALGTLVVSGTTTNSIPVLVQTSTLPPLNTGVQPTNTRNLLGDWSFFLGTQNSRKPGYGS